MKTIVPDVLVLTSADDATTDYLVPHLERSTLSWFRWDPGTVPSLSTAGAHLRAGTWGDFEVNVSPTTRIRLSEVAVVWLRRPTPTHARGFFPTDEMKEFIEAECGWFFRGLWASLDAAWVNHPDSGRVASYKPVQLALAARLGFSVPRTYIGNDPCQVGQLWEECKGRMIVKPFHQTLVRAGESDDRMLYTSPISAVDITQRDAIRACPSIWQEYVPKRLELRITVVGDQLFTAAIDSQASERTRHDWRDYDHEKVKYRPYSLPHEISEKCFRLLSDLNLHYGALDVVLTPDDRYVFLEINPFGQWAWIQELCHMPIAEAHCQLFSVLRQRRRPGPETDIRLGVSAASHQ